jgi:protein phosphatase methylesterase 1
MDKDLTIAQMQGKFKLSVIANVGHLIHEDDPQSTFNIMDDFITKFRIPGKVIDVKPIIGKLGGSNPKIVKYSEGDDYQ